MSGRYSDWDTSKRHILLSVPREPRLPKEGPALSLEELLFQQQFGEENRSRKKNYFNRCHRFLNNAQVTNTRQEERSKKLRYSRELEKRALRKCAPEDIIVERYVKNRHSDWNALLGDSTVRRTSKENDSLATDLISGFDSRRPSEDTNLTNRSLRSRLSRRNSLSIHELSLTRRESKDAEEENSKAVNTAMRVEKRIRVPTPFTIQPIIFNLKNK